MPGVPEEGRETKGMSYDTKLEVLIIASIVVFVLWATLWLEARSIQRRCDRIIQQIDELIRKLERKS